MMGTLTLLAPSHWCECRLLVKNSNVNCNPNFLSGSVSNYWRLPERVCPLKIELTETSGDIFVEYWIRFEWNKRGCTYVHWRIYSSRYLDTLELNIELNWICIGNAVIYIQCNNGREMWELLLGANWQKRTERITMKWEPVNLWANVWIVIPLFASCLTPVSVNGNHHWL